MRYVLRRIPQLVAVLFAVSLLTFLSLNLLGDPLKSILGPKYADREVREQARHELHLDDSVPERYVQWIGDAVQGDFGRSYNSGERVSAILGERIPVSLFLMVYAQLLALVLAVPIAIFSAYRADRLIDRTTTTVSFGLIAVPSFALGVLLLYVLAVSNDVFPARYLDDSLGDKLYSLFLPAITLALPISAVYMRILRADLIRTLQEDFIQVARAKGLPTLRVLLGHALRPSSVSLVTVIGLQVGALLGGALVVENIFSIPGLGKSVVDSVFRKDYLVVQSIVLIIASAYVIVNFVVDVLYAVIDPRVRSARSP
jgi:peptide/nickel transport system permease protein